MSPVASLWEELLGPHPPQGIQTQECARPSLFSLGAFQGAVFFFRQ